jgi:beta-lactamase regulating signal transducer with metallopeptidase domain
VSDTAFFAGSWLLTFLLHSTVWLGGAWLLLRWLFSASPAAREWIWKGATIGALLSPTLQLTAPQWFNIEGLGARYELGAGTPSESTTDIAANAETSNGVVVTSDANSELIVARDAVAESGELLPVADFTLNQFLLQQDLNSPPMNLIGANLVGTEDSSQLILVAKPVDLSGGVGSLPMDPGSWPEGTAPPDPTDITLSTQLNQPVSASMPLWLQVVMGLWLAGAVIGVSSWGWHLFSLKRSLRNRMPLTSGSLVRNVQGDLARYGSGRRNVRLSVSDRIHVPVAFGCLRGEVCLPMRALNDLDASHQRSMVGHELAHLRRRDPIWITFYNVVQRILFMQPLLIIARREAMHAAEELCDSWACSGTGNRFAMAECLTQVADWLRPEKRDLPVACMAQAASPLQRRVERLLDSKSAKLDKTRAGRAATILVILLLGMAMVAPGVASHFTPAETAQTVTVSVDLLNADLDLAQARLRFLKIEVSSLERDLLFVDPSVGDTGDLRQTLDRLRQQLSLLEQITLEISRELPATNES